MEQGPQVTGLSNYLTLFRDESFNSITGLNGSGKSNILDSICFVLGITNMSTVRATNLQVSRLLGSGTGFGGELFADCVCFRI